MITFVEKSSIFDKFFSVAKAQLQPNVCYALHDGDEIKFGDVVCGFHEEKLTKDNDNVC